VGGVEDGGVSLRKGTPMSLCMAETLLEQEPGHDVAKLRDAVRGIISHP